MNEEKQVALEEKNIAQILDITEYKGSENVLWEMKAWLQALIHAIPDIVYFKDAERHNLMVNRAFEQLVGLRREEIVGKTDERLFPPDLAEQCRKSDEEVLRKGEILRFEEQTISEKGEETFFETIKAPLYDARGNIIGLVGVSRDITERKKVEEALRDSEDRYRNLFENAQDVIAIFDLKGNVTTINEAVTEYGFKKDEIIGKNMRKFVSKKYWPRLLKDLAKIARGKSVKDEIELVTPKGKRMVEYRSNPIRRGKKVVGIQTFLRDITERARFEERLSALNTYSQQLNMAESMEEIYELTLNAMEKTLGFDHASFMMVEKNTLCVADQRGYPESLSLELPLNGTKGGITVKAAKTLGPVLVPDTRKEREYVEGMPSIYSELAVPVKLGDRVLAVLNVESTKLAAFDEKDQKLLEILASHAATAIRNFRYAKKQRELVQEVKKRSEQLAALMKTSTEMLRTRDLHQRLKVIAGAIHGLGWRRAVIALNDENLETTDLVTVGLTPEEEKYLWENRQPGHVWRERLGPEFERFRIGEFYYLPWSDPFVREHFATGVVYSKIPPEEMVDWDPQDLLYAPLRLPGGSIVGRISVDDPLDGRRPTKESLAPLELFLYQAAVAIENAQLIKDLETARNQLKEYADELESKVEERTRELMESEKKYSTLVEHANDGVVIVQDGRLSFMNKRLEDMTGYSREELMGKSFVDMLPESEVELVKSQYEARMRGKPVPAIYETKTLSKSGDVIPVELNAAVISYGGRPADLVVVRDIRERKKMEEQLLRAEKLATIGELAASVGHDLRNPLTGICGAVYYLKMKLASKMDEKSREMLNLIEDGVRYSNKIVNDLLDFSGEIHLNRTMVGVRSLIKGTLSRIKVPKRVKILDLSKNTPKVPVDIDQMTRTFENLIRNAIEAMPNRGRLEIKSKKRGNSLKITFRDTGMGISKKNLSKLFTPLFTTKAKGVGMGLAICKRIINAHGGSINIESREGKGTLVTVTIPITEEKSEHRE